MTLDDLELSLMTFPQHWDGSTGQLNVNLLMLPVGDPTLPLGKGPKFAGTSVQLNANIVTGLDNLPKTSTHVSLVIPFTAKPLPVSTALYDHLYNQLVNEKGLTIVSQLKPETGKMPDNVRIKKTLPPSYTQAFPFKASGNDDFNVSTRRYGCDLRKQAPPPNTIPPDPDKTIAWGQILSYALHQPKLAEYMGLIYHVQLTIPSGLLASGGFVYFTLDASVPGNPWVNDWQSNSDTVKSYAARLPALTSDGKRPLFAATLMPVVANPSKLDMAQFEAEQYDDGFAQIVHANQPTTIDAASLDEDQIAPGTDAGIQIGWDDEQVTVWLNNQLDLLRYRLNPTLDPPPEEAPLGVMGYRVDVRIHSQIYMRSSWNSLCKVDGNLPFNQNSIVKSRMDVKTPIDPKELWVSPVPVRPNWKDNINNQTALLPLYFAQWAGSSLVLPDPVIQALSYAVSYTQLLDSTLTTIPWPTNPNPHPDLTSIPRLLYGKNYDFRVRLVDLTGGGPAVGDVPIHPGPAPQTMVRFRRYVPPKSLEVVTWPAVPQYPEKPPDVRKIDSLDVRRPRIGYPEALFANVDPTLFSDPNKLTALIKDAWAKKRAISVPDPDVDSFEVRVEARVPAHDSGIAGMAPGNQDGVFRVIYSVNIPFPIDKGLDPTVTLRLNYTNYNDISTLTPPDSGTTILTIPTARDIRVRLFPRCAGKTDYYGTDSPLVGPSSDYIVRYEAQTENPLFQNAPQSQLQAFYFQPGSNLPQLLAQQLELEQDSLTFSGKSCVRTFFGASGNLRHMISGDASSITFSNQKELLGHWIIALVLDLERDWTWDGLLVKTKIDDKKTIPPIEITREIEQESDDIGVINQPRVFKFPIGVMTLPRIVAEAALGKPGQTPDRARTRLIFFDAVDPNPTSGGFPRPLNLTYTVTANFVAAEKQQFQLTIKLPITTPPVQIPKIASVGIAESLYTHSSDYSQSSLRDRYLWIEFDQPLADSEDNYFARVLAYGPDPLLASDLLQRPLKYPEVPEPALPIEPETIRRIFPGQSVDDAGLKAMTQMVKSDLSGVGNSGTFFLLPLPPGMTSESLELFGFWTYEFRVGHNLWSTAQGRFGRPLRVTGIQHPAPHLICTAIRSAKGIEATAPYATTVFNGMRLYSKLGKYFNDEETFFEVKLTHIWFMIYAQVQQADGTSYRNVLLIHKEGMQNDFNATRAIVYFSIEEIEVSLAKLGLPGDMPLSVLAVEILPGEIPMEVQTNNMEVQTNNMDVQTNKDEDPLGKKLGDFFASRRILRTSPLVAIPKIIC